MTLPISSSPDTGHGADPLVISLINQFWPKAINVFGGKSTAPAVMRNDIESTPDRQMIRCIGCLAAGDPYQGMGLGITIERLRVRPAESTVSPSIAPPCGARFSFPLGDGATHVRSRYGSFLRFEWQSIVPQGSVGPVFSSLDFAFVHLAGLPPVTMPFVAVIDDDEALCASLVDLMRSAGYRAEPFASAEQCLLSANRFSLDCIIADVHMPGMGGLDLIRKLHEQGIMTPVILITALSGKHLDEEAASIGALCLLRKPFETNSLLGWVERSLLP
jgi:CheY-like chemotaxis protein